MNLLKGFVSYLGLIALSVWAWAQPADAPAPTARPELQKQMEALQQLIEEKDHVTALERSAALLLQARQEGDKVAEAYAQRAQAIALERQDRPDDAVKAWSQAAALWKELGDAPYEVEALLGELWAVRAAPAEQRQAILNRVLSAAQQKTSRPLALAEVLRRYAQRFHAAQHLDVAAILFEQALKVREPVAPDSLETGICYYWLGEIYHKWRNHNKAIEAYERALQILEKTAPKRLERLTILSSLAAIDEELQQYARGLERVRNALKLCEELNAPPQAHAALTLHAANFYFHLNQFEQAENLMQKSIDMCLQQPNVDRRLLVLAYERRAAMAFMQSQIDRAIEYADRAWEQQEQIDASNLDAARILALRAIWRMQKYNMKEGVEYAERAWTIAQKADPNSPDQIQILVAVALARMVQMKHNDALELLERARTIALQKGEYSSLRVLLSILRQVNSFLGRTEQARQYQQELDALGKPDTRELLIQVHELTTQTQSALIAGNYIGALQMANRGLELCRQITDLPMIDQYELSFIILLGTIHGHLGDYQGAINAFTAAHQLCRQLNSSPLFMASIETNLGATYLELGRIEEAQEYLTTARERLGGIPHMDSLSCFINLGKLYAQRGELDKAASEIQRVADWLREQGVTTLQRVRVLTTLSEIEIRRKNYDAARTSLDEARRIYDSLQLGSPELILMNMHRARIYMAQGEPTRAEEVLREALQYLEEQRGEWIDPEMRALSTEPHWDAYILWAQQRIRAGDHAGAAIALERSRARVLTELIHERQVTSQARDEKVSSLFNELEQVRKQQRRVASQLIHAKLGSPEWTALHQQRNTLNQRYRSLLQQLERESPRHFGLLVPKPIEMDSIQQALEPGTVLLYYGIAQEELLIVAVSRDSVRSYTYPVTASELNRLAARFRAIVAKEPLRRTDPERAEMFSLGRRLHGILVRPAEESLKKAQRVVICPTGQLNLLPWSALVVSGDTESNAVYWASQVAIHFIPSWGVYLQARDVRPAGRRTVVAVLSYEDAPSSPVQLALRSKYAPTVEITPLPDALREADAVAKHVGQDLRKLVNQAATPEAVRTEAQGARVIHFICHAFASDRDPYSSVLLLAPPTQETGMLSAAAVMDDWRLQADLVMLAACESSEGVLRRYEGLFGLARAFLFAGARTVGATLWKISDEATYSLMDTFYAHYARGVSKDEALRQAQQTLLKSTKFRDPYFWSGFVLIGDYRNDSGLARSTVSQQP
ncbi:MAG: CHAT domain-containing protein [Fimbriimonadales bacterium]|nr:CHAT domain-containing protein [Fimbriimonadales bacterium]